MDAMSRLHKSAIRVTDIAGQYWCERQMELYHLYGRDITKGIKIGKKMHEELENETNVPVVLEPRNYADYLYKELYTGVSAINTLHKSGITREISIYGSLNGYKLVGKIDQLERRDGEISVVETKTRQKDEPPSDSQKLSNRIQPMFYRKMLADIQERAYTAENFRRSYNIDKLRMTEEFVRQLGAIGVKGDIQNHETIANMFFDSLARIGKLSDKLYLRYVNQFTGKLIKRYAFKYDTDYVSSSTEFVMKFWSGERESLPVPENESWKCTMCTFYGNKCKVWWKEE